MKPPTPLHVLPLVLLAALSFALTGCLSSKYKRTDNPTAPVPLNLASATAASPGLPPPPVAAVLQTVIVYHGPGSWKKEAFWDEYVVSLTNTGDAPVKLYSATLVDALNTSHFYRNNAWDLEKQSRINLKKFEQHGESLLIGTGVGLWTVTPSLMVGAAYAGNATLLYVGTAAFVGLPALAIGTGVRTHLARKDIDREFASRRLALPLELRPHETLEGSLFFPISPGPRQLLIRGRTGNAKHDVTIDLNALAGLHLMKPSTALASNPGTRANPPPKSAPAVASALR